MAQAKKMLELMHSGQAQSESNVLRIGRKRDEKRDRKLEEREEIKTSLMPPPSFSRVQTTGPSMDAANYTHYVDKCFECFSKDLVIKTREGTIVC
jgi:hypothetical protein